MLALGWLGGCAALLATIPGRAYRAENVAIAAYLLATLACSVIALGACAVDKWRARRGRYRISERLLHRLELGGGWAGSWIGQQLLRHKTRKPGYRWRFRAIAAMHLLAVASAAAVLLWRSGSAGAG